MERWSAIDQENIHLATIRVYAQKNPNGSQAKPRIILTLPPNRETPDEPGDEYDLDMVNEAVENQIVVAEREKEPGTLSRARTTILTGRVRHECNLKPSLTERYRQRIRDRTRAANTHTRTIKILDEEKSIGGRGAINMLTSGVANTNGFTDLVVCLCLCSHIFKCSKFSCRNQNQNQPKVNSSVWHVCLATSCSTCSLGYSARGSIGLLNPCVKRRSSPKRILKKSCKKLHSCIGVESITVLGSCWRTSRAMEYALPSNCSLSMYLHFRVIDQGRECPLTHARFEPG